MRGYYVGLLAAIRLDYVPSLLGLVDGRGALLVSEAEGFFMTYLLIRRFEQPIGRTLGKVLIPFGRNSLNVYVAQSFVMFLAPFVFAPHRFVHQPPVRCGRHRRRLPGRAHEVPRVPRPARLVPPSTIVCLTAKQIFAKQGGFAPWRTRLASVTLRSAHWFVRPHNQSTPFKGER
jgi:hypothetical protein